MEEWRDIPGYEGYYQVSNMGRVKSLARMRKNSRGVVPVPEKIKTITMVKDGNYERASVCLSIDAKSQGHYVGALVLKAFVGRPFKGEVHRHLDGNGKNCKLDNLAWGTQKQNIDDRTAHGTTALGEKHGMAKLTYEDILRIRELTDTGTRGIQTKLAREYGVDPSTISLIHLRKNWGHV